MKTCPACEQPVSPFWTKCRACETMLIAPPAPVQTFAAAPAAATPAPVVDHDPFYVSAPIIRAAPPAPRSHTGLIIGIVVAIAVVVGAVSFIHSLHHTKPAPAVLAPRPATAAIPGSLAAVTRQQAESTRHFALQAAEELIQENGSTDQITLRSLGQMQPGYQWIDGSQPSTTYSMVSTDVSQDVVTVAVSTPSKEVCAFGRFSAAAGPSYVDMANMPQCRAVDAPAAGWGTDPGGSTSDLPDDSH
jgi:hypothetical protein